MNRIQLGLILIFTIPMFAFISSGRGLLNPRQGRDSLRFQQKKQLFDSIVFLINKHYYDDGIKNDVVRKLKTEFNSDKYNWVNDVDTLVTILNADLLKFSGDGHLYVQSAGKRPFINNDWQKLEREREALLNYGFTDIQILDGNVGYLKIREFMHPKRSLPTAVAAMKMLEKTKALIIDIRDNGGGYAGSMEYILNHFFDEPPVLLSTTLQKDGKYTTTYSSDLIFGEFRVNTPVYILINRRTASAAEYFAFVLQEFKKAVIVGEKSAGGANKNEYFPLPFGLRISVSIASPRIATSGTNWEGRGIIPDIETKDAKGIAIKMAIEKISKENR